MHGTTTPSPTPRPTRQCLRGPKPGRTADWEQYLDWCRTACDCARCVRLQIEAS